MPDEDLPTTALIVTATRADIQQLDAKLDEALQRIFVLGLELRRLETALKAGAIGAWGNQREETR